MTQTSLVDILYGIIPVLSLVIGLFIGRIMERRMLDECIVLKQSTETRPTQQDDVMATDPWNLAVYGEYHIESPMQARKPTMKGEQ